MIGNESTDVSINDSDYVALSQSVAVYFVLAILLMPGVLLLCSTCPKFKLC